MSLVHTVTKGHKNLQPEPPLVTMLESEEHVAAGTMPTSVACIATCGHGIILPQMLLRAKTGSVVCGLTTVRVCIDVPGSGYHQRQCRCLGPDPDMERWPIPHRRVGPALGNAGSTPHLRAAQALSNQLLPRHTYKAWSRHASITCWSV